MPCFKGIAVSVHAEGAPLPEYSVTKQSRVSRVGTYIPVPPAKIREGTGSTKPEASKFAISITLLTPGLPIPYSTPKATPAEPYPRPNLVAGLPTATGERSQSAGVVTPYTPISKSENETIAAYIYFDGRAKEEVATLLRPGEETWVNSRWVQVPDSEGGGLAEREFLFREVGLERWLNGLDLDGADAASKLERRRQKFEKRRRRVKREDSDEDLEQGEHRQRTSVKKEVLRYGDDERSPIERLSDEEELSDDSDDDAPPEAAGQIKVAMFRVLASGEIKKGEYSPQFDAHDDDDGSEEGKGNGQSEEADVDHTTSFAKPKTLDPKSISTQTVTGIDGPDKPYAVFTFFYRGERQLQKMGILRPKNGKPEPPSTKRRSAQIDFSNLNPLKPGGTVGFTSFRDNDPAAKKSKSKRKSNGGLEGAMEEDSEEEYDEDAPAVMKMAEVAEKDPNKLLSPEDIKRQEELAGGVGRIKLKRAHSAEPLSAAARKNSNNGTPSDGNSPPSTDTDVPAPSTINNGILGKLPDDSFIGSPMKKQRGSVAGLGGYEPDPAEMRKLLGATHPAPMGDILAMAEASQPSPAPPSSMTTEVEHEEEL